MTPALLPLTLYSMELRLSVTHKHLGDYMSPEDSGGFIHLHIPTFTAQHRPANLTKFSWAFWRHSLSASMRLSLILPVNTMPSISIVLTEYQTHFAIKSAP